MHKMDRAGRLKQFIFKGLQRAHDNGELRSLVTFMGLEEDDQVIVSGAPSDANDALQFVQTHVKPPPKSLPPVDSKDWVPMEAQFDALRRGYKQTDLLMPSCIAAVDQDGNRVAYVPYKGEDGKIRSVFLVDGTG